MSSHSHSHSDDRRTGDEAPDVTTASDREGAASQGNVGRGERVASVALGGLLVARGLRRGSFGGAATALAGGALVYRGITGRSRLYRLLESSPVDTERLESQPMAETERPTVDRSITVGEDADELPAYWRDPDRLSRIVGEFAEISDVPGGDGHRWRVQGPLDRTFEWETRLVEDDEEQLRWEAREGASVPHEYAISFEPEPGGRGTIVTLEVEYEPPGGAVGDAAMDRLGFAPEIVAGRILGRFKSLVETGEIPTTEDSISARGRGDTV
ncbi:SRPBCC family protein [Halopiger xanaduensis]|uniref:Cyclase/dehydrase n=1 Tax=Halopiger xanaduensis (strain DSM 18323 / JCM 14033 / SH-6) TaxID=797210 RepID=F8D683_HALXS|nr:SRPBCC family protein [Halopiger xanaduensis]AEH35329.1 cyclase/dehydrase [Halopiger xanaduensis SH-6]